MFAGATREVVFSDPAVIDTVNRQFIPVIKKAGDMAQAKRGYGHPLLSAIASTQLAPQGLAVLNSDGQVLSRTLMFANQKGILEFLNHGIRRFRTNPRATAPVKVERFMRFPDRKMPDMTNPVVSGKGLNDKEGENPILARGGVKLELIGRALDSQGRLSQDTVNQESYSQDYLVITQQLQNALYRRLQTAGNKEVDLPERLARTLVSHSFLGHLDVQPLDNPRGARTEVADVKLKAKRFETSDGLCATVYGTSHVRTRQGAHTKDGAAFSIEVVLKWSGVVQMASGRISSIYLLANGSENLKWRAHLAGRPLTRDMELASLPAGRPLNISKKVRFGIQRVQ